MSDYKILKDCFLGRQDEVISLNQRQADNLLAGCFIMPFVKVKPTKKVEK